MNNNAIPSRVMFATKSVLAMFLATSISSAYAAAITATASNATATVTTKTSTTSKKVLAASAAADASMADDMTATTDDSSAIPETPIVEEKDPYQGFNRAMYTFNDKIDVYFLKPIATFYNKVMPKPLNKGIHNVFDNINTIPTIANDLLQANFYQASSDTWRVMINTTIGIGGLFDMAERMQLEPYSNDFGLTLAHWGYADSNYLVLPFFGPNTIRDGLIGLPVDYFGFSLYPYIEPPSTRYQLYMLGVVDKRAQLLKFQDVMDEAAFDRYIFVRNAYLQRRAYLIEENNHRSCCERWLANKTENADNTGSKAAAEDALDAETSVIADLNAEGVANAAEDAEQPSSSKSTTENYD